MEPRDDLVSQGVYCLAEPGQQYLIYFILAHREKGRREAERRQIPSPVVQSSHGTVECNWHCLRPGMDLPSIF